MTVLLATHRLPANVAAQARDACKALDVTPVDWVRGIPRVAPLAVISGLDHGARRIPDDLIALLEATPALRLVLCAQEPLVKSRVVLGDGRICVLAPPVERAQLESALREAILPSVPPLPRAVTAARRFEALRRLHWIAWARGRSGPAIALSEQHGATVVLGSAARDPAAVAAAMAVSQGDAEREAALGALVGESGAAHLSHDGREWTLYWPVQRRALWLCSPHRAPVCWNAARGIATVANRRLLRMPAFSGDQLVATWADSADGAVAEDLLPAIRQAVSDGGSETMRALDELVGRRDQVTGLVMEVR